ncbi:hypothetical protein STCU_07874 [Strigomonas culicis]|nr:hypothetical protein STCU_07874 [Strigomonas culicis]|eukprot:EPY23086.1 hypothetical protein STCU_07874 [Strigomonas culicis]
MDELNTAAGGMLIQSSQPDVHHRDIAGTSFHSAPLSGAHSALGWKFSHFIGCLDQVYGTQQALAALDAMYRLSDAGSTAHRAQSLLLQCVEHFPSMNLAEALLAAQGMPVRYVTRTKEIPPSDGESPNDQWSKTSSSSEATGDSVVAITGFGTDPNMRRDSSTDQDMASPNWLKEDAVKDVAKANEWTAREASLTRSEQEGANGGYEASEGWLDFSEQQRHKKGPAHAHSTEFRFTQTFTDSLTLAPADRKVISKKKFKAPIRDPLFYDKRSDLRNGVPLDAGGKSLGAYLDDVSKRRHLFEVSMFVGSGSGTLAGKAISTRYTLARESAARAYLGAVLQDLTLLK